MLPWPRLSLCGSVVRLNGVESSAVVFVVVITSLRILVIVAVAVPVLLAPAPIVVVLRLRAVAAVVHPLRAPRPIFGLRAARRGAGRARRRRRPLDALRLAATAALRLLLCEGDL